MSEVARPSGWQDEALRPIPLAILTGFLGAGKSTRLNLWLKDPRLADTLVIVNEFGEVGLDHLLIEASTGDMILMAAGCLCCTIRGDLIATLEDLLRRRDNQRMRFFKRVIIETTGLADPVPILQAVIEHPYLAKRFALTSLTTLVDAVNGAETLQNHAEARRQVAIADQILITKGDLADDATIASLRDAISTLTPSAHLLPPEPDATAIFEPRFSPQNLDNPALQAWLAGDGQASPHDHSQGHDPSRHGSDILSFTLIFDQAVSLNALSVFREALRVLHGVKLLRIKGIIALKETPDQPAIIHHVQHIAHPILHLPHWPGRDRRTRIVFITQGLERSTIERFWQALVASDA